MKVLMNDIILSERGSFSVVFAFTIMIFLSLMAFSLDLGYFAKQKSGYQECADMAALSAAENLCCGRAEESALNVVHAADITLTRDNITIRPGFYDAYNEYDSFRPYKDFISEDDENYPEGEANNAVMVIIENRVESLTGFHAPKLVKAAAVAYLPRVSIVAGRNLKIGPSLPGGLTLHNGNLYAEGTMTLRDKGGLLEDNVKAGSGKRIKLYNASSFWNWQYKGIRNSDDLPEIDIIRKYILSGTSLKDYVEKMRQVADVVYTPSDSGTGPFYGSVHITEYGADELECYFDFSQEHEDHRTIFFDSSGSGYNRVIVYITPHACADPYALSGPNPSGWKFSGSPCMQQIGETRAKGTAMQNITFITNCPVYIPMFHAFRPPVILGGRGMDQLSIISDQWIYYYPGNNPAKGVNFFCNTFSMGVPGMPTAFYDEHQPQDMDRYIRVIAMKDIRIENAYQDKEARYYFKFAPPCPALASPALGHLILNPDR